MPEISAKLVKELRDKTGAGMMDCKKALQENEGDIAKAGEWLRQKGIASAEKKAGKVAAEGLVDSYIHTGGRIGVLVEVNCQTDFVARNEDFQALVRNIAMQIAACPNVEYVRTEDIPATFAEKEKEIEMGRDDLASKPEAIREKIVVGRIEKRLKELSLMDQPYIKDQSITVQELVTQNVAKLGENIQVRRFVRFVLGEGIEKEESDFAAEVAAQTGAAAPAAVAEAPAVEEAPAPVAETPAVKEAPASDAKPSGGKKKGGGKKKK
ncbi:MAG: translation elongation factor Ts [Synechococcales cyanobacterium K44_A2020_017]|nr:translation elongation factor Ts [Synechococcales cyanobacterium K32_A2020_035]MBF2094285.1 translation elongation factor Ts [Synechococcales cyanobacterium K44_A2020_017]